MPCKKSTDPGFARASLRSVVHGARSKTIGDALARGAVAAPAVTGSSAAPSVRDPGNPPTGRPRDIVPLCSHHQCRPRRKYLNADSADLAEPGSRHSRRGVKSAVRTGSRTVYPVARPHGRCGGSPAVGPGLAGCASCGRALPVVRPAVPDGDSSWPNRRRRGSGCGGLPGCGRCCRSSCCRALKTAAVSLDERLMGATSDAVEQDNRRYRRICGRPCIGCGPDERSSAGRRWTSRGRARPKARPAPLRLYARPEPHDLIARFPCRSVENEAGDLGFEPRLLDPESSVLPLHQSPKRFPRDSPHALLISTIPGPWVQARLIRNQNNQAQTSGLEAARSGSGPGSGHDQEGGVRREPGATIDKKSGRRSGGRSVEQGVNRLAGAELDRAVKAVDQLSRGVDSGRLVDPGGGKVGPGVRLAGGTGPDAVGLADHLAAGDPCACEDGRDTEAQWSRPSGVSLFPVLDPIRGVRSNSPVTTTRISSSKPSAERLSSNAEPPWSVVGKSRSSSPLKLPERVSRVRTRPMLP